jgi:hypothetical protein
MSFRLSARAAAALCCTFWLSVGPFAASAKSERPVRIPDLHAGQKFVYRVRYQMKKVTRAETRIASSQLPAGQDIDAERWLSIEVRSVHSATGDPGIQLHTQLLAADGVPHDNMEDASVDFTLLNDGRATDIHGLDALNGDEQALWRQWIAQFALGWTFPPKGVKPGEKWKKSEPVQGAAIAHLVWEKDYEYVRDEPCPQRGDNGNPTQAVGRCAVIVTSTVMKQHGSKDDATPDDFRSLQLKTAGTAQGKSQVITFISLQTGFVMRATEDSTQVLDVLIAKVDDSNKAHYNVDATSHAEVVLMQ